MKHVRNIRDLVSTIEHYGGSLSNDPGLIKTFIKEEYQDKQVDLSDEEAMQMVEIGLRDLQFLLD